MLKAYNLNQLVSQECLYQSPSNGWKPSGSPCYIPSLVLSLLSSLAMASMLLPSPTRGLCHGAFAWDCTLLQIAQTLNWELHVEAGGFNADSLVTWPSFRCPWTACCPGSIYQEQVPTLHSVCTLIYLFTQCVYRFITVGALSLSLCWCLPGTYHSPW